MKLLDALAGTYKVVTKEGQLRAKISIYDDTVTWTTPKAKYLISIERDYEEHPQVLLTLTRFNHLGGRKEICVQYAKNINSGVAWARRTRNESLEKEFGDRVYTLRRCLDFETINGL